MKAKGLLHFTDRRACLVYFPKLCVFSRLTSWIKKSGQLREGKYDAARGLALVGTCTEAKGYILTGIKETEKETRELEDKEHEAEELS
jgi:hypothetical protein